MGAILSGSPPILRPRAVVVGSQKHLVYSVRPPRGPGKSLNPSIGPTNSARILPSLRYRDRASMPMQEQCLTSLSRRPAFFIRHGSNPGNPAANPTGPLTSSTPPDSRTAIRLSSPKSCPPQPTVPWLHPPKLGLASEARSTTWRRRSREDRTPNAEREAPSKP